MIPNIELLTEEITEEVYPDKTYKIIFASEPLAARRITLFALSTTSDSVDRISGYADGLESVAQAIYLILSTERYQYIIYSWDYGVELVDLYGQPMPYVMSELPRRITEALTQDDRIEDVVDFEFEVKGKRLHTTFVVVSNVGNISAELEVEI